MRADAGLTASPAVGDGDAVEAPAAIATTAADRRTERNPARTERTLDSLSTGIGLRPTRANDRMNGPPPRASRDRGRITRRWRRVGRHGPPASCALGASRALARRPATRPGGCGGAPHAVLGTRVISRRRGSHGGLDYSLSRRGAGHRNAPRRLAVDCRD